MQRAVVKVLYHDSKFLCINKPAVCAMQGNAGVPAGRNWVDLFKGCQAIARTGMLSTVHRLDSNTSGALILAKTPYAARAISKQFRNNTVRKEYIAIVDATRLNPKIKDGSEPTGEFRCNIELTPTGPRIQSYSEFDGSTPWKPCSTAYTALATTDKHALLRLEPTQGRKHQLRLVSSELLNAPIIGDFKYRYNGPEMPRHLLHCHRLEFQTWTPSGKMQVVKVEAPLPLAFVEYARAHGLDLTTLSATQETEATIDD